MSSEKVDPEFAELRRQIDQIDAQILELVARRVHIVLQVGEYKRRHGLRVYDPDRERRLLEQLASRAPSPLDRETVRRVFERLVDESRRLEQHHVNRKPDGGQ